MTGKKSFTKHENKIFPGFRDNISKAESTEDVKKFFVYTAKRLFEEVFEGRMEFDYQDFVLTPNNENLYELSERLVSSGDFSSVWGNSDLPRVVTRLAESAVRRYRHLEKHPEKTDSKIRM